ncbi:MAG: hemolysin secretion protein D [Deltaproteobacteria bacterium]|nr:MAG: hemolysin secretion protein D [Deltaproteobacteria bacterium]
MIRIWGRKNRANPHKLARRKYNQVDIEYMNSLSSAVLSGSSSRLNLLLYIICLVMLAVVTWAYFAKLDERTRGVGKTIPPRQIQVVQNLEGGIIEKILVSEGQRVKSGQVLVVIDDTGVGSSFAESSSKLNELKVVASRLKAEAGLTREMMPVAGMAPDSKTVMNEKRLFQARLKQHNNKKSLLEQQLRQKEIELGSAKQNLQSFRSSLAMINREIKLSRPLLDKRLLSELEYLAIKQRQLEKIQEVNNTKKQIEKLQVQIVEEKEKVDELEEARKTESMTELNQVLAEIERLSLTQVAIMDRVTRTNVRSPVDGVIKQLLINTVGGVVRPGMDILEIVPDAESLVVETKISPSDIAFIYPGQKAVLKFTAYDFAIYGGLDGEVTHISADTITDPDGGEFYLVRVKADKDYIGSKENPKKIIVGMTAQVDIITGKKTVMQYLLKPILRAKNNALRER